MEVNMKYCVLKQFLQKDYIHHSNTYWLLQHAFDLFLEQGGAASDQDVLQFLGNTLLQGYSGIQFDGDIFGCSTISVANADGGYLFGRNFDWQKCDALVVTSCPKEGYASISTVNLNFIKQGAEFIANMLTDEMMTIAAIYAPLDGMNEKGLCVSVNMIQDSATIHQDTVIGGNRVRRY